MEYKFAQAGMEDAILDFANYVFSQAHVPHDFKTLLPKVYARDDFAPIHAVALDEKKGLRGMVAVLDGELVYPDIGQIRYGFIGTVSVHPYARGEGHMKTLMPMAMEAAKARGLDLLLLGGRRQRYQYFGFERGMVSLSFTISKENIRHYLLGVDAGDIAFAPLLKEHVPFARTLQESSVSYCRRDDFESIVRSWNRTAFVVQKAGEAVGYLVADKRHNIHEIQLKEPSLLLPVVKAWIEANGGQPLDIHVLPHAFDQISCLSAFAEDFHIEDAEMLRIFNWEKLLHILMRLQGGLKALTDGQVCIRIGEENYLLSVKNGMGSAEKTNREAQLSMSEQEAVSLLFSPLSLHKKESAALHNWLPLPLAFSSVDGF